MIHYQLRCSAEHAFDGWFRDSAGFDTQASMGLVACPECGDTVVNRALMAPRINKHKAVVDPSGTPASRPDAVPDKAAVMPDEVRAVLQKLRAEVERNCDNVGPAFAEEARRIHNGDVAPRGIYGDATPEQAEALAEDGIKVARIPWVPRSDG